MTTWWTSGGQRLLTGALWLTGAGIVSKFLGAFYRIPLARILGSEGVGLYQMVYPVYTVALSLATAGLPVAISVLVAERASRGDHPAAYRFFLASFWLLLILGCGATFLLLRFAETIAHVVLRDDRTLYSLWAIAPAVLLTALMAAFRGFFQGYQQMAPTALSQVAEQIVRVATILAVSGVLVRYGIDVGAAGATSGAVAGGMAGLAVLWLFFYHWRRRIHSGAYGAGQAETAAAMAGRRSRLDSPMGGPLAGGRGGRADWVAMWKSLLVLSLPISLGGLVIPLMQTVDAALIPRGLQAAGFSASQAASLFGEFSGMANALVGFPIIVTGAVSASLVPAIASAWKGGHGLAAAERYRSALRLSGLLAWPAAFGMAALAGPICDLLFHAPGAAEPLFWLAPTIIPTAFYQVASAALQGMGRTAFPVLALALGAALKVAGNLFLLPRWGLIGAAMGSNGAFLLSALLVLAYIGWRGGFAFPWGAALLKPALAATMMAGYAISGAPFLASLAGEWAGLALSVASAGLVYGLTLLAIGGIQERDLALLPRVGPPLAAWHRRFWGA
ncbi:oligosaccharide flippase family protein [Heliobacterium gestii]|uniref:Oligosaccharide flippase family protein n=1 Tax=Heliomicrobium gestii TaxID=2699 RepID=A0A845LIX1_HELGE|nr:polysaccharide biosynthesis protein [Heliomicrobium gestii]MBM7866400.1 stage V sporulation protein B [Heliomicrobium gestii]MZP42816.1 oligosaccharide flippase family protein [Heliomicrobium gestii]